MIGGSVGYFYDLLSGLVSTLLVFAVLFLRNIHIQLIDIRQLLHTNTKNQYKIGQILGKMNTQIGNLKRSKDK